MKTFELNATPEAWEEVACIRYGNWDTVIKSGSLGSLNKLLGDCSEGACSLKKKGDNAWEIECTCDGYSTKWDDASITVLKHIPWSTEWKEISQEMPF